MPDVRSSPLAQNQQEKIQVMRPVADLFKGMQLGDSALVPSVFIHDVTLASIISK